jgi:glycosyltransferase involved in cell wall biosynthesis
MASKKLIMPLPLVSVVMPSLNQAPFLEVAVRSVLAQSYDNVELVVADGQSTDGTVELLVQLQQEFAGRLRWVSQQDTGPAQAINTAIAMAHGDIIGWLNSDDMYAEEAIAQAVEQFTKQPNTQMVYGLAQHIDAVGNVLSTYPTRPPTSPLDAFADGSFICQPTVFMRRGALALVGPLDESIKTAFDFELWMRFFKRFPHQITLVRRVQAYSRLHAACLTQSQRRLVAVEGMKVLSQHLNLVPPHWFWTHLDELCETYPFGPDATPLIKQIESFILEVKGFFSAKDLKDMAAQIRTDYRLILAKPGLIVTVQPDGWVSKHVAIKYRWTDKPASAVSMRCMAAWPVPGKMRLRVGTPDGDEQMLEIEAPEEFVLRFEVPATEQPGMMMWTVDTAQTFIPAKHDAESQDKRKLSFRVLDLQLEE